jgi:recombination protein RecA
MAKQSPTVPDSSALADTVVKALNKKMGKQVARRLGDGGIASEVHDYISTQSVAIDNAIGRPGIPTGRVTLIVGPEASGKSTLVYHLLAETQRRGGLAVLADAESRYDCERAVRIGIDPDQLVVLDTSNVESIIQQIDIIVDTARQEAPDDLILVAWDSVAATPTKKEVEGEFGEYHVGEHAKLLSGVMRRWANRMAQYNIAIVIVNQLRESLSFFNPQPGKKTMIAEHPLGYHASLNIEVSRVKTLSDKDKKDEPDAILSRFKMVKNTVAPPFRVAYTMIRFDNGFDRIDAKLRLAEEFGWVAKTSSWYTYPAKAEDGVEPRKFQRGDFGTVLEEHPELDAAFVEALGYVADPA